MLKRTNKTSLTDDELIIFDVMFDIDVPINFLKSGEDFSLMFNYQSHSLNTNDLKDAIEKLVKDDLMRLKLGVIPKDNKIVTLVGLTENGGSLWEMERLPIWERFVSDSSYDYKGYWELSISSPTIDAAKGFLRVAQECNLYELIDPNDVKIFELQGKDAEDLIPWKAFNKVYEVKSRLSDQNDAEICSKTDWELYQLKTL